ncbi:hypothetical protein [Propionicicella superfundia]|uniref:hypothetical protein n=1 Tax=Propionicicella superfundia TaxID=348582 RepID=UPI00041ECF03|nr:hypothetical protein [Propionicicella superfundia]
MAVMFHTPPAWPAPPAGFVPPAGWQPDPSWGAAPAGWVFYTDNGAPVAPPPGAWQPPAPAPQQPGPYGPPPGSPAQQGFGVPPQQPPAPAKRSRTPLLIGIGVLVLVLALGAVFAVLWNRSRVADPSPPVSSTTTTTEEVDAGPTLTLTQFDGIYELGETFQGATVTDRWTSANSPTPRSNACEQILIDVVLGASDLIISETTEGNINAGRYLTPAAAAGAFADVTAHCSDRGSGTLEGGSYLNTDFSSGSGTTHAVAVAYGNVVIIAYVRDTPADDSIARELRDEVADAAS